MAFESALGDPTLEKRLRLARFATARDDFVESRRSGRSGRSECDWTSRQAQSAGVRRRES